MEKVFSEIDESADMPAFWKVVMTFFHAEGIYRIACVHFPPVGAPDQDHIRIKAEGFPAEWIDRYIASGLHVNDPIRMQASMSALPFRWSDIRHLRVLTLAQEAYLDEFASVLDGDGISIPVFGPNGRNGYVGLGFPAGVETILPAKLQRFQVFAQYAHQRYCDLIVRGLEEYQPLSPRELQVLRWVARGKSNSVIADIIGVSGNTVDTHLRRIYAKLHVSDRVSATLAGLGQGLITMA